MQLGEPPGELALRERAVRGAFAGLISGALTGAVRALRGLFGVDVSAGWVWYCLYAVIVGATLAVIVGDRFYGPAVTACGGIMLGCLGWLALSLTLVPLVHGQAPTWSADAAARTYPEFVGDLLQGGLAGVLVAVLVSGRSRRTRKKPPDRHRRTLTRIVIVGGGFAGVSAAKRFEHLALRGAPVDVTLVSDSNFLLFSPMLAEAASGAVEARHISVPVRAVVSHTRFRCSTVDEVDPDHRMIRIISGPGSTETIPYDHLILATGSVPRTFGVPGVDEFGWTLKSLSDATRLRDHVLELLERAEQEPDRRQRRRMLTFVVAGAGFAGTEMIAELFDLVHGVSRFYPAIEPSDARFLLVHPGNRILPELSSKLGAYAQERLQARGIECLLGLRVSEATPDQVRLTDGRWISTQTFVWTAGNRPSALVANLSRERDGTGALVTDPVLRGVGWDRVWAVGDCARIPDVDDAGRPYPPTAQHAIREGRVVADNILAVVEGREPTEFRFHTLGVLVALGHRTAVGDILGWRFSGLAAWFLWRGIYLSKLPGIEKRIRVLFDWLLELVFPRDIVVTTHRKQSIDDVAEAKKR